MALGANGRRSACFADCDHAERTWGSKLFEHAVCDFRIGEDYSGYDEWPPYGLDPAEDAIDPIELRWELAQGFGSVFEALRPVKR